MKNKFNPDNRSDFEKRILDGRAIDIYSKATTLFMLIIWVKRIFYLSFFCGLILGVHWFGWWFLVPSLMMAIHF